MENYGILSLVPIVITILIALKFKNIIIALISGAFFGLLIYNTYNPFTTLTCMVDQYIIPTMGDLWNAKILLLLVVITGFVKLLEVSGGTLAFAQSTTKYINTKKKAQLAAWLGGIGVFFSDVGSPLVVGPIFRPLFDRLKISREKLAWIADTTASPVSILIPFLGWGAYIMGLIEQELNGADTFSMLISTMPYNFYAILSVLLVPFVVILNINFAAMKKAEDLAEQGIINGGKTNVEEIEAVMVKNSNVWVMLIPIIMFIVSLVLLQPKGFPFAKDSATGIELNLILATIYASLTCVVLMLIFKIKSLKEILDDYFDGLKSSAEILIVLVLAWVLGNVSRTLGTPDYVVSITIGTLPNWSIPAVVFLTGAFISFATGSSWGTFSIMMPLAIPLALHIDETMLSIVIAAVLSGGLFGDHCSPISDTTMLSSAGSGCDHIAHVETQVQYALIVGVISALSFVVAAILESNIVILLSLAVLYATFIILSKIRRA